MRVQLWIAAIIGVILMPPVPRDARAQYEGQAQHASFPPAGSGLDQMDGPGGIKQSGLFEWPQISPFAQRFEQHFLDEGLWFERASNRTRRYFISFDYLAVSVREPKGLIGDERARTYKEEFIPIITEDPFDLDDLADLFMPDALDYSTRGQWPPVGNPGLNWFDPRRADDAGGPQSNGFRLRLGFTDPDDSGMLLEFWHSGRDDAVFDAGDKLTFRRQIIQPGLVRQLTEGELGLMSTIDPFGDPTAILQRNLLNLSGIPIDDGSVQVLEDGTTLGGVTVPYDMAFQLIYRSESAGATLDFIRTPFIKRGRFRLRGLFGVRYTYLNELFKFEGEDSGMAYDNLDADDPIFSRLKLHSTPNFFDDDDDGVTDPAGLIEDDVNGDDMVRFIRLDEVAEIIGVEHPGRYRAFLKSELFTHLAGPEVGVTYDVGGDFFRLVGHSKFGLMVNIEKLELSGNNIGDGNNIGRGIDLTDLDDFLDDSIDGAFIQDSPLITPTPDNPFPNAFSKEETHTHLSPMLEQSIMAEMRIFRHLPGFKRFHVFDQATFTVGWTITWVDEVARPTQSIIWQANPRAGVFPAIKINRDEWYITYWNFGVNVPY